MTEKSYDRIADDALYGAAAIADFLGVSRAKVYHYVRKRQLPIGKLGKVLIARRLTLRRAFDKLTA